MDARNEQLREQRSVVKFSFCQGKSHLETLNCLCTTDDNAMMSRAMVYHWYEEKGRASASLKGGPGAPCRVVTEVILNIAEVMLIFGA